MKITTSLGQASLCQEAATTAIAPLDALTRSPLYSVSSSFPE